MLVAPSADVIDEWWRIVSANPNLDYKRLAPDFYTYTKGWPYNSAPDLADRVAYWQLSERDTPGIAYAIEQQPRSDVVSGGRYANSLHQFKSTLTFFSFFVRSKSDPSIYWYAAESGGYVYAWKNGRSRFRVDIEGEEKASSKVLIRSDKVTIASASNPKLRLGIDDNNELYLGSKGTALTYVDLKKGFLTDDGSTVNAAKIKKVDGFGEEWELVA